MNKKLFLKFVALTLLNTGSLSFSIDIFEAIRVNNTKMVKELISNKSFDIDKSNIDGDTPLTYACRQGHLAIVKLLIENGADVNKHFNSKSDLFGRNGRTPLSFACANGCIDIVKELLKVSYIDINKADTRCQTPFYKTCYSTDVDIIKLLIKNGADINRTDKYGHTPLYYACLREEKKYIKLLIANGANIDEYSIGLAKELQKRFPDLLKYLNLALAYDNAKEKILFLDSQTNDDYDFLAKRHLIFQKKKTVFNNMSDKIRKYSDCRVLFW